MLKKSNEDRALERGVVESKEWRNLHGDHLARYQFAVEFVQGCRVLDAGTGPGYGAVLLKESGAKHVLAVDISSETIAGNQRRFQIPGLDFLVDDCERLSKINGLVDVVCSFENIEHLQQPQAFIEAAARILTPNGVLLCSTPDRAATNASWVDGRPGNKFHTMEWYRDEFHQMLLAQFEEVSMWSQVESISLTSRREAAEAINAHMTYLWSDPLLRVIRSIRKMLGNTVTWESFEGLAIGAPTDYPIVPNSLVQAFGSPRCHFAICRRPKR